MRGGDCGKSDEGRGLWGTVGKVMRGGDCGKSDEGRGLWASDEERGL